MADDNESDGAKIARMLRDPETARLLLDAANREAEGVSLAEAAGMLDVADDAESVGRGRVAEDLRDAAVRGNTSRKLTPEQRQRVGRKARQLLMRRRFSSFVRGAWSELEGTTPLEWCEQLQGLCDHMQQLAEGWLAANGLASPRQLARVIETWQRHALEYVQGELLVQNSDVNMPPGSLKSRIVMVFFPAWVWLHAPRASFVCASSNDEVVRRDSDDCRKLVEGKWYRTTFGVRWRVRLGTASSGKWQLTCGGWRISRPMMAGFVGLHADFLLVDDPDDPLKVWSDAERVRVHHKYRRTFANRVNHEMRSVRVVAQQIVHGDCLSPNLRRNNAWSRDNRKGWATFCVAMEAGHQPVNLQGPTVYGWVDPRRKDQLLMPSRWPQSFVQSKKTDLGTSGFNAQYNQNAEVLTGGMFAASHWRFFRLSTDLPTPRQRETEWDQHPAQIVAVDPSTGAWDFDALYLSVDATFGDLDVDELAQQDGDRSAVGLGMIGVKGLARFVLEDFTDVLGFDQTCDRIVEILGRYDQCRRILVEKKANGSAIMSRLDRMMREQKFKDRLGRPRSIVVAAFEPGQNSKIARGRAMSPDVEAGCWFLRDGAGWLPDWMRDVCQFPKSGVRDDRVDYMSQLHLHLEGEHDALRKTRAMGSW